MIEGSISNALLVFNVIKMTKNLIDRIAINLTKLENDPNLSLTNPKLYSKSGIILESFTKQNKLHSNAIKNLVQHNPFFRLGTTTIQTGLFKKTDKRVAVIEWEHLETLKKSFLEDPDKVLKESVVSKILTQKILWIINDAKSSEQLSELSKEEKYDFEPLIEDHLKLYTQYFPEELEHYRHEGRHESELEKKFNKRVPKGSEFHFADGKVANNLQTWINCIQLTSSDVVQSHIIRDDFYSWLEDSVKVPELARICMSLKKRAQAGEISEKDIRTDLLKNINKTGLSNIVYEKLIAPLLKSLKSDDQAKVQDAVDKLFNLGDDRVVEPLMEKVFDSSPQVRRKIITGLGKLGDKRATPTVIKVLKHSTDLEDKLVALKTLGHLKDKRAKKIIEDLAGEHDELGHEAVKVLKSYDE